MGTIHEMLRDERPRERLWERGAEGLKTQELLAILLRTGQKGRSALVIAEEILQKFGSLADLGRASARELAKTKGVGMAKAVQLKAAFELGARTARTAVERLPLDSPELVFQLLGEEARLLHEERLQVLVVDTRLKLMGRHEISRGSSNETVAVVRDVLHPVLLHRAYGFILCHNHPSGDPAPSRADHEFTLKLRDAARLMDLFLVDHVILGVPGSADPRGYYSFKEAGLL